MSAYAIKTFSRVKTREIDRKIALSRQMSNVRKGATKTAPAPVETDRSGIPDWLEDVAEQLGVADYLDSDEMPPELERLLPLAKGFIDGGGVERLLAGAQKQQPAAPNEGWY